MGTSKVRRVGMVGSKEKTARRKRRLGVVGEHAVRSALAQPAGISNQGGDTGVWKANAGDDSAALPGRLALLAEMSSQRSGCSFCTAG